MTPPVLDIDNLQVAIGERSFCQALDFKIEAGRCVAILGANGAGKTTLLQTLAGLRQPNAGAVRLGGQDYTALSGRAAALGRAYLPQLLPDHFASSVLETVLVGRHPHLARWQWESADDLDIARAALREVGLSDLEQRDIQTLSGGERQRVAIAALLAQQPQLYLLDEPLNHLDLHYQIAILQLFRRLADAGQAVVLVLHDLNLATRFADQIILLDGEGGACAGLTEEILQAERLSHAFHHPLTRIEVGGHVSFIPA